MKLFALRTFLVRQDELEGGKRKDIVAHKGTLIDVTEKEAIMFWGDFTDSDKGAPMSEKLRTKLLNASRAQKISRVV